MITVKRHLSLVLVLLLVLGLFSACGQKASDTGGTTTAAQSETTKAETAAQTEKEEAAVISLTGYFDEEAVGLYDEINSKFSAAYPNLKVELESLPGDQFSTIIKTRLTSGDASDIYMVRAGAELQSYVDNGYAMDITNVEAVQNMYDGCKSSLQGKDGKIYAYVPDQFLIFVFYNKDIFQEHNASIPTNIDEWMNLCETFKKAGVTPMLNSAADLWATRIIPFGMASTMLYKNDPDFDKKRANKEVKFEGSAWEDILKYYDEMNKKGYFQKGVLSTNYDQAAQLFAQGKAAMWPQGLWGVMHLRNYNPDMNLGIFLMPGNKPGEDLWVSAGVGNAFSVYSKTPNKEQVEKYINFVLSPEINSFYCIQKKAFSTVKGVSVDFDPSIDELSKQMEGKVTYPFLEAMEWPTGLADTSYKLFQELLTGTKSPKEVAQALDKEWDTAAGK